MSPVDLGLLVHPSTSNGLTLDAGLNKVGMAMMEEYLEQGRIWGRQCMIQIGIPEDVVDMYIEKIRREVKDPKYQLFFKLYFPFLCLRVLMVVRM
jgi:hypothetical protein